jgi:hypothetical protein
MTKTLFLEWTHKLKDGYHSTSLKNLIDILAGFPINSFYRSHGAHGGKRRKMMNKNLFSLRAFSVSAVPIAVRLSD